MALVTANNVAVIRGDIMRPLVGVWTADLVVDASSGFDAGTPVTITSENGYELKGIVDPQRGAEFLDAMHVRVLGGMGGMLEDATARNYVQPGAYVRDVVNGLVSDAGETLSTTTSTTFLASNLAAWSVLGGNSVARNLRALLDIAAPTASWRILADGTLWIGVESWPAASATYDVLYQDPADKSFHIGSDSPFIVPGTNLDGVGNVARVNDTIADGKMRSRVWIDIPGTDRGINYATQQMARQALAGVDYYAMYACQVVSQSADFTTADVQPIGARNQALLGGLQRVPVRVATGIKVQMAPGSTVLLGWDGGNPEGPYVACGLSGDTATSIQLAGSDPVITKADLDSLINAISSAQFTLATGPGVTGGTATPLIFVAPTGYGSTKVGAGR